jgi:hypothetical protein
MEISRDFKEWLACLIDTKTDFADFGVNSIAHA